jgi:glycosyltransferase involved in cell wall biosynthesis
MGKISVVITVYNEESNVQPLVKQITEALRNFDYEIVYVDDGSKDATVQRIKELKDPHIKLVQLRKNYGQCPALKAGIDYASGDYIVTMDGDLQNDPADIPMMIKAAEEGEYDLVAGIREKRKDGFFLRKFPSRIANWIIRKITGADIIDNGCALKVFRAEMAKSIPLYGELHRFISVLAHFEGASIKQVKVRHHARIHGISKYGLSRTFRVMSDLILLVFFRKYLQKPMHFFGTTGILISLGGAAILLYLLIIKLMGHDIWGRPVLLLGILLFIMGFQIVTIGIILDYQMRTYYESQHKSPYQVKKVSIGEK